MRLVPQVHVSRHESGPDLAVLPPRWAWWEDGAHDGVTNMARDEALMAHVRRGEGIWRWYGWTRPTVSFGRNERVRGRVRLSALAEAGMDAVRRPTGGRALLHAAEITYSVALPLAPSLPWRAAYDAVNRLLLAAIRRLEVPAHLAAGAVAVAPDGPVCFDRPADGEITVGGRKLVGSAVWRQGAAFLQHGSILLRDEQPRLAAIMVGATPPPPADGLSAWLAARSDAEITAALRASAKAVVGDVAELSPYHPGETFLCDASSHARHLADPQWLWRR